MKHTYLITFFFIGIMFSNESLIAQAVLYQDTNYFYKNFKSVGIFKNDIKIGKWEDLSPTGIIYAVSCYDTLGNRAGTWKINFPDGSPRKQFEYSNDGIIRWCLFRYKMKLAEVIAKPIIPDEVRLALDLFESELFDQEKEVYRSSTYVDPSSGVVLHNVSAEYRNDPFASVIYLAKILSSNKFTGKLTIWSEDKTIRREYTYSNGVENRISFFYNSKRELTKQDEYRNDTIIKTVTFKKNGEKKEKIY